MMFEDRIQAGKLLAQQLLTLSDDWSNAVIFALPRGGVVVAEPFARHFEKPIIPLGIRKIGAPGHEEFAIGAIAEENEVVMENEIIQSYGFRWEDIEPIVDREQEELKRRLAVYRGGKPIPDIQGKIAIVIDDGLATGATMEACVRMLRKKQPKKIIVAVPVASAEAAGRLRKIADTVIAISTPAPFFAVGQHYRNFPQTTDEEVLKLVAGGGFEPPTSGL